MFETTSSMARICVWGRNRMPLGSIIGLLDDAEKSFFEAGFDQ